MSIVAVAWARADADELLRRVVSRWTGRSYLDVQTFRACRECASTDHGRPIVVVANSSAPSVSLSRAGAWSAVAVTDLGPVGIDIEAAAAAPESSQWTHLEAVLKAHGTGLSVRPDPHEWAELTQQYTVRAVPSPDGLVASVAVRSTQPFTVVRWQ